MLGSSIRKIPRFQLLPPLHEQKSGNFLYNVNCMSHELAISPQQVATILLLALKTTARAALVPAEVTGCVIAVPSYFTASERKSLFVASTVAGLNCKHMIKETTAIAINYGFLKKFTTPSNLIFIDFGYSSFQIAACAFSGKEIRILAEKSALIGGRDIDETLAEHFIQTLDKADASKDNRKFSLALFEGVEKMKRKMSFDEAKIKFNVKRLNSGFDNHLEMQRLKMEELCKDFFTKIEECMGKCLSDSKLRLEEIHAIEIVGGSSRIPLVKELVKKVFGKLPVVTMDQDEAVSRGCYLRSMMPQDSEIIEIGKPLANDESGPSASSQSVSLFYFKIW